MTDAGRRDDGANELLREALEQLHGWNIVAMALDAKNPVTATLIDRIDAHLSRADASKPNAAPRTYWLIEATHYEPRRYFTRRNMGGRWTWETNPLEAERFKSKEAADEYASGIGQDDYWDDCIVVEHMDLPNPTPAVAAPPVQSAGEESFDNVYGDELKNMPEPQRAFILRAADNMPESAGELSLDELLKAAAKRKITPEEEFEQRVSWVYGMQKLSEPGRSRDEIRMALRAAEPAGTPVDAEHDDLIAWVDVGGIRYKAQQEVVWEIERLRAQPDAAGPAAQSPYDAAMKEMYEAGLRKQQELRDRVRFLENELCEIGARATVYKAATPTKWANSFPSEPCQIIGRVVYCAEPTAQPKTALADEPGIEGYKIAHRAQSRQIEDLQAKNEQLQKLIDAGIAALRERQK